MNQNFPFDHFLSLNNSDSVKNSLLDQALTTHPHEGSPFNNEELSNICEEVLNHLKTIVPELKFKTYFENNLSLIKISETIVEFSVATSFIKKTVELYKNEISEALKNVLGKKFEIELSVKDLHSEDETSPREPKFKTVHDAKFVLDLTPTTSDIKANIQAKHMEHINPAHTGLLIDRSKTFETFIVGPTNNMAQAAARAVAQTPGKEGKYPSLYIHSGSGLGKTHLLHAVANEIADRHPHYKICLITAKDFMDEMIRLIQNNRINEFVKKYTENIDILMIDDIHELKNKGATQDQFFHVFNEMHNKGKQLIFTSDKRPKDIEGIEERIKTRLQWGLVVDIQPPDLETRIAILRRKMESLDLYVTEEVLTLIASKIKTNIRELEGSLVRLKAVSELMNVEIEVDLVKEQLNFQSDEDEKINTIESVVKATAQFYRISIADLKSKGRSQEITNARHIAMYLSKKIVNATYQEIGAFFGGRDHSTVIHAVEKISNELKTKTALAKDITMIESNL